MLNEHELAKAVFEPDYVVGKTVEGPSNLYRKSDGLFDDVVDYENNPAHRLKLIEFIAYKLTSVHLINPPDFKETVPRHRHNAWLHVARKDTAALKQLAWELVE